MPIIFDELTVDVTPPTPTTSATENAEEASAGARVDPQSLVREMQRIAERAERLNAD